MSTTQAGIEAIIEHSAEQNEDGTASSSGTTFSYEDYRKDLQEQHRLLSTLPKPRPPLFFSERMLIGISEAERSELKEICALIDTDEDFTEAEVTEKIKSMTQAQRDAFVEQYPEFKGLFNQYIRSISQGEDTRPNVSSP